MKEIRCNVCGDENAQLLFLCEDKCFGIKGEYRLVRCQSCGLVYLNPQPEWKELERHYPAEYDQYAFHRDIFQKSLLYEFFRMFKRKAFGGEKGKKGTAASSQEEKAKRYLDFGCGGCETLSQVRARHPSWELHGLDISPLAKEACRAHGFDIFLGELEDARYPDTFFDIVNMKGVIEHLPDPRRALTEVRRILKPGGQVQLSLPNIDSLAFRVFRSYWFNLECPRHLFLFSPATLRALLEKSGLEVRHITPQKNVKEIVSSVDYLLGRGNRPIHPLLWHAISPLASMIAWFHKAGIMTAEAVRPS